MLLGKYGLLEGLEYLTAKLANVRLQTPQMGGPSLEDAKDIGICCIARKKMRYG